MISGYGHAAVIVFFVISGFLVGGRAYDLMVSDDVRTDWTIFLIDRFTRIFLVLIPALAVTAIALAVLVSLHPVEPFLFGRDDGYSLPTPMADDFHWERWFGAVFLVNGFMTPTLNSNAPLWSLAYEWFYYIAALTFVLLYRRVFTRGGLLLVAYATVLLVLSILCNSDIVLSGFIWLLGGAARLALRYRLVSSRLTQYLGISFVLALTVTERFHEVPGIIWGVGIAFMIANTRWTDWHVAPKLADRLAGFSYSLYVTHFPVMLVSMGILYTVGVLPHRLPYSSSSVAIMFGILIATIIVARGFAYFTEDRTKSVRNRLLRFVQKGENPGTPTEDQNKKAQLGFGQTG
jgi:peptidoglycan/LPS O-acetylase OafA/YrhL